jgi:protein arginine kinase activator
VTCERCGKNAAEVTYTEYSDGDAQKRQICGVCARALGFDLGQTPPAPPPSPPPVVKPPVGGPPVAKLLGILSIETTIGAADLGAEKEDDPRQCPGCGMTGNELRREPLFGCPRCYETFHESLDPLFRRLHGAVRPRGRVPGGETTSPVDVDGLRRDLHSAIANEDFEEAARLRDRLRQAPPPATKEEPPEGSP